MCFIGVIHYVLSIPRHQCPRHNKPYIGFDPEAPISLSSIFNSNTPVEAISAYPPLEHHIWFLFIAIVYIQQKTGTSKSKISANRKKNQFLAHLNFMLAHVMHYLLKQNQNINRDQCKTC